MRMKNIRLNYIIIICFLAMAALLWKPSPAQSGATKSSTLNLEAFKSLPVLDEGRVKPLDTYARNLCLRFSGRTIINRQPAIVWLARLLFQPESSRDDKIFLINHADIPMALKIKPEKRRRYSYAQIEVGFEKIIQLAKAAEGIEEKNRTLVESEILRVYYNVLHYVKLSKVFSFAIPHADFRLEDADLRAQLKLPAAQPSLVFGILSRAPTPSIL